MNEALEVLKEFNRRLDDFRDPVFSDEIDTAYDAVNQLGKGLGIALGVTRGLLMELAAFRAVCRQIDEESGQIRMNVLSRLDMFLGSVEVRRK